MLPEETQQTLDDIGLLILRVAIGGMMIGGHGWGKLDKLMSAQEITFADPFGLGPGISLFLAVFAEVFCALLVMLGLATRVAAVPLVITMLTAAFIVHADDPFGKKEFALVYMVPFLTLFFTGPGRLSIDQLIVAWRKSAE